MHQDAASDNDDETVEADVDGPEPAAEPNHDGETSPFRDRPPIPDDVAEHALTTGSIIPLGQMPWSSNTTVLCDVETDDTTLQAIYKPHRGEQPLWDFPAGLGRREQAAYVLSKALGWDLVPPTVVRDGPAGLGSVQLFVPSRFEEHYFTLQDDEQYRGAFERLTCFDVVANSTDRKSGHVLLGTDNRIYAIDNGLSFHPEFKLRTVLWDFAGEPIPDDIVADLMRFVEGDIGDKYPDLVANLDDDEVDAMIERTRRLIYGGTFPIDPTGRRWPWPLV